MSISTRGYPLVRRAVGGAVSSAVVAGLLLTVNPAPSSAATVVTVTASDIRGDEALYAGWHQGYDHAISAAAVVSSGLELRDKSQVINGYLDNAATGITASGMNADLSQVLPGATYDVTAGGAYFQVPLFVDADHDANTAPVFTTLRPLAPATGETTIAASDEWVASKTFGDITAGTTYPLSEILAALDGVDYKTLAFGVLTQAGTSATVSSIGWDGKTYRFAAASPSPVVVRDADVSDGETASTYASWHQGYDNAIGRQQVTGAGLVLAGQSQVIKGFPNNNDTLNDVNVNLLALQDASYTVAPGSGAVYLQVPVKFDDGSGLKFTTLRNNGAGPGVNHVALSDAWQSSKALDGIPANTDAALSDIIAALGNYKTIAVGFLTLPGTTGTVSALTFGDKAYTFADTPAATSTSVVRARDIAPDETVYAGWHQGSATGVAGVAKDSTVLELGATRSQVINGYPDNSADVDHKNVDLVDALTGAAYTVVGGNVYFQVPLFVADAVSGAPVFTTLRPAAPATAGTHTVDVGQLWVSSKAVGSVPANTPTLLGDILSEFTTYKVLAFGVFSDVGDDGKVSSITWDGVTYTFLGNRSPVAAARTASTKAGHAVTVTLPATDADGDVLTYAASNSHGTSSVSGNKLTFTPAAGFVGRAVITYAVADQAGASANGTLTVTVGKVKPALRISAATGRAKKTFLTVKVVAPGAVVNGGKVDIKRFGKVVASGKVVGGKVRLQVGKKLKKGSYTYGVYYRGTASSSPVGVLFKVRITK